MSPCFAGSVLMVLGVVAFFNVISAVAEVIAGYQRYHKNRLRLSRLGFKHIDRDGTGLINQTEFQAREHARAHTHTYIHKKLLLSCRTSRFVPTISRAVRHA